MDSVFIYIYIFILFFLIRVMALSALRGAMDIRQVSKVSLAGSKWISHFFKIIFYFTPSMNWSERQRKGSAILFV